MYRYSQSSNQSAYRSTTPLSNNQIAAYAPSVLAESAHESRGERYTFIPTVRVIDGLRNQGFEPFEVRQTRVRNLAKRDHTKHMVRMRHSSTLDSKGEVPEIILLNSHDGSSSYQLLSGIFRFVCSNGLIAGDVVEDVRVRHSGHVVDEVIEGSFRVLADSQKVISRISDYKSISLSLPEQRAFANAAIRLRWDENAPIGCDRLLTPQRWSDKNDDLWTVFNRVQEGMVKGGVAGKTAKGRRMHTRAVAGVTENVKLNRALWTLADNMAAIKQKMAA
jgi:hypothetical protein